MNKKVKITLITILIILVLAVISGILTWYIIKWNKEKVLNTPEDISNKYFELVNEGKYENVYDLLTEDSKQNSSKEEFVKAYSTFFEEIGTEAVKTDEISIEKIDTYNVKVSYTNNIRSIYGDIKYENVLNLKKQDDKKFYIDWTYSTIYPNFESGDKFKIKKELAKRGSLIDRNGVLLAGAGYIASIGVVPGWMNEETKQQDIKKISELLGMSVESINKKMTASYVKPDTFVELDTKSKQETELLSKLREIEGIKINDVESRVYPLGEKAVHITGYVQKASSEDIETYKTYTEDTLVGRTGLELQFDERLRGKDGYEITLVDKEGKTKNTVLKTEKTNGEDIKLTIDANIQSAIYDIYKNDNSATVLMYPGTGELIALVSTPAFDPNKALIGMTNQEWNELNGNPNNPLIARFLKRYVPGSTFKPIIGAIALQTGTINSYDEYEKSGTSWQKDSSWGSYNITTVKEYDESATLLNALIYSDNIFFAKTALKIGEEKLEKELKELGFEKNIGFEMNAKNSQISNNGKFENEIQLADSGYGQGEILINPIHYAALYGIFANNGNMVKPYIEMSQDTETTFIKEHAFSKQVTDVIKDALIQAIENPDGTASSAKIAGLKIAGKTGTAETKTTKEEIGAKEVGWFNAFIADEKSDKQYVIVSMIENVENKGGSSYVVDKVKRVFEKIK